jgi:hypothetical protein
LSKEAIEYGSLCPWIIARAETDSEVARCYSVIRIPEGPRVSGSCFCFRRLKVIGILFPRIMIGGDMPNEEASTMPPTIEYDPFTE